MSDMFSKAVSAGRKFMHDNPEKVREMTEKAGDFIDEKTDHKYADKVDKVQQAAENFAEKQ